MCVHVHVCFGFEHDLFKCVKFDSIQIDGKNRLSKNALWFSITCADAACPVKMDSLQESAEELFSIKSRQVIKGVPAGGVMVMPIVTAPKKVGTSLFQLVLVCKACVSLCKNCQTQQWFAMQCGASMCGVPPFV